MGISVNEIIFNTVDELRTRIYPALKSKCKILCKSGYSYIKEEHVWDFMLKVKWQDIKKIALCEMVNDVLHTDNVEISDFFHANYKSRDEIIYQDLDLPKLKS